MVIGRIHWMGSVNVRVFFVLYHYLSFGAATGGDIDIDVVLIYDFIIQI